MSRYSFTGTAADLQLLTTSFCQPMLQYRLVDAQIGPQFLQPRVFLFLLPQMLLL